MFDSVCAANFSKPPPSVNIFLNKILFANVSRSANVQLPRQSRLCPSICPHFLARFAVLTLARQKLCLIFAQSGFGHSWTLVLTGRQGHPPGAIIPGTRAIP